MTPPSTERSRLSIDGFESDSETTLESHSSHEPRADGPGGRRRLEDAWRRFRANRTAMAGVGIIAVMVVVAIFARPITVSTMGYTITLQPISLAPYSPSEMYVGAPYESPSLAHPFGTDWAGRDMFSRVLVGGRYSLTIGLLAVFLMLAVGAPLGALAGYYGGWVDSLIMRTVDILYAFPFLVLAIVLVAVLGQSFWNIVLALVAVGWVGYARLLRGEILVVREAEYVTAAKALGTPDWKILYRHILPNALAPVIVHATLNIGTVVLAAAALGFLGLGLDPSSAEWGSMLARGRESLTYGHYHVTVFPGLAIFLFVLAINLVGDGINDALDPQRTPTRRLR